MVSMTDYQNFGNGFGMTTAAEVAELNKALNTGNYSQAGGLTQPGGRVDGAAIQVESLENSLKVLTYSDKHVKLWKKISKTPAYSTVEEYNVLEAYGSDNDFSAFTGEGQLPQTEDSKYRRKAAFVKFLGTTREVTHPMTLVRSSVGNVVARESQNGILWLLKQLENALFWGDSSLAPKDQEGVQFDGLNSLVEQTIDCRNNVSSGNAPLTAANINEGAEMILENYGTPTDMYLPYEVLQTFSEAYFPKERIIQPLAGSDRFKAGVVFSQFQTHAGAVEFNPDIFLQKTKKLGTSVQVLSAQAPTAPAKVEATVTGTGGNFKAATYKYAVTAVNRFGESAPVNLTTDAVLTSDKCVTLTITNSASMTITPDYFNIYRSEADGASLYLVAKVPADNATSQAINGTTVWTDTCEIVANTYTAFMGEMTPEVLTFRQLAPMMKMDLAILGPTYRWMQLIYGTPVLYMPKRFVKFTNIATVM